MPYDLDRFLWSSVTCMTPCSRNCGAGARPAIGSGSSSSDHGPRVQLHVQRFAISSLVRRASISPTRCLALACASAAGIVLETRARTAEQILGSIDAMKLRSCMTLFHQAAPEEPVFTQVLDRYYGGVADEATDARLGG